MISDNKFLGLEGLQEYDAAIKQYISQLFSGAKVWIGTVKEYYTEVESGSLLDGTLVVILDDFYGTNALDAAILDEMIL